MPRNGWWNLVCYGSNVPKRPWPKARNCSLELTEWEPCRASMKDKSEGCYEDCRKPIFYNSKDVQSPHPCATGWFALGLFLKLSVMPSNAGRGDWPSNSLQSVYVWFRQTPRTKEFPSGRKSWIPSLGHAGGYNANLPSPLSLKLVVAMWLPPLFKLWSSSRRLGARPSVVTPPRLMSKHSWTISRILCRMLVIHLTCRQSIVVMSRKLRWTCLLKLRGPTDGKLGGSLSSLNRP